MKGFWISLLLLVALLMSVSCKSTKKNIEEVSRTEQEFTSTTTKDVSTDLGKVTKKTTITQVVNEKYEVVSGTKEVQPIKTTIITTEVEEVENKSSTSKRFMEETVLDTGTFDSLSLGKETEGMEVVKEIVGGVTGAFIGDITKWIIGTIFLVILIFIITKLLRRKPNPP